MDVGPEAIGELGAVVGLDGLDVEGEEVQQAAEEVDAGLGGDVGVDGNELEFGEAVDGGILVEPEGFSGGFSEVFDIDLDFFAGGF